MSELPFSRNREDYAVGWICAIQPELVAARAMLDEIYKELPPGIDDGNGYLFGRIGRHNVVIASLPSGSYGTNAAARVAARMQNTFPQLKMRLMVGIGGGVPRHGSGNDIDIRLGDVVVSDPSPSSAGVIQYDMGKTVEGSTRPKRTHYLNKPPEAVRTLVAQLKSKHKLADLPLNDHLEAMIARYPALSPEYAHQGLENDRLFEARYKHEDATSGDCLKCDAAKIVKRAVRPSTNPMIFYGTIASGNQVVKDSVTRDYWQGKDGALCFEMEAAGLMDDFPCLVIRGICDYADRNKNKEWQPYAAATAAAYAKDLVLQLPLTTSLAMVKSSGRQAVAGLTTNAGRSDSLVKESRMLVS